MEGEKKKGKRKNDNKNNSIAKRLTTTCLNLPQGKSKAMMIFNGANVLGYLVFSFFFFRRKMFDRSFLILELKKFIRQIFKTFDLEEHP